MDEMTLHRKRRLNALIQGKPYFGSQLAFAKAAGLSEGRVSQLAGPKDSFGERSARSLQERLNLEDRYFEIGYSESAPPDGEFELIDAEERELLHMLRSLTQDKRRVAIDAVRGIFGGQTTDPKDKAQPALKRLTSRLGSIQETVHEADRSEKVRKG